MEASAAPRQGQREGPGERLAEVVVLAGIAALATASVLPLVLVAIPVFLTLCALRTRSWRWKGPALLLCLLPALAAVLVAAGTRGVAPVDVAMGFVDVQLAAGAGGVRAVRDGAPFDWAAYGLAVWPYALAGGAALGAGVASVRFVSTAIQGGAEGHTELKIRDAARSAG